MKLSLPLKLGIGVVLLFAAVIATCLLWTPVRIRYYAGKLKSGNPVERIAAVKGLMKIGGKGLKALAEKLPVKNKEAKFLIQYWNSFDKQIKNNEMKRYPLHVAARENYAYTAELFLHRGADPNAEDYLWQPPIAEAVCSGYLDFTRHLLKYGADVNVTYIAGISPLQSAIDPGGEALVRLLIENGADLNHKDNFGWTPLWLAGLDDCRSIFILLVEKGADINLKSAAGWTPLDWAAGEGHKDIVEMLLDRGAHINAKDDRNSTALHSAAYRGYDEVVKLLVDRGAELNAIDNDGYTPTFFAEAPFGPDSEGLDRTLAFLRSRGGKTGEELKNESSVKSQGSSVEEEEKK